MRKIEQTMSAEQITATRQYCLQAALAAGSTNPDDMLKTAERFYAFIVGSEDSAPTPIRKAA